jgi:hypothetical protein
MCPDTFFASVAGFAAKQMFSRIESMMYYVRWRLLAGHPHRGPNRQR